MRRLVPALLATACLAACGGGSGMAPEPAAPMPPAQPSGVNFTAFTKELLRAQSDSAQPLPVSAAQFAFPDDDNPQAFADVLPSI